MTDRRSQPRYLDCELVVLHWQNGEERMQQLGNVDDASLGGLGIRVDYSIAAGTPVTISYESPALDLLHGVVKYAVDRPEGVFLGIELSEESTRHMTLSLASCALLSSSKR